MASASKPWRPKPGQQQQQEEQQQKPTGLQYMFQEHMANQVCPNRRTKQKQQQKEPRPTVLTHNSQEHMARQVCPNRNRSSKPPTKNPYQTRFLEDLVDCFKNMNQEHMANQVCPNRREQKQQQKEPRQPLGPTHSFQEHMARQVCPNRREQPQQEPRQRGATTTVVDPITLPQDIPMAEPPIILLDDDEILGLQKKNCFKPSSATVSEQLHSESSERPGPRLQEIDANPIVAVAYASAQHFPEAEASFVMDTTSDVALVSPICIPFQQELQAIPICCTGLVPMAPPPQVATPHARDIEVGMRNQTESQQHQQPGREERQKQPVVNTIPEIAPPCSTFVAPGAECMNFESEQMWSEDVCVTVSERIETQADGRLMRIVNEETLNPDGSKIVKIKKYVTTKQVKPTPSAPTPSDRYQEFNR